jgi:hypothetical protein
MGSLGPELMPDSDGVPPSNRQRLDVLSLSFWLLAVSHRSCAILFLFLVFTSSFSVTRFQLLVFRFRVSRSSLSVRYHGVIVAVDLYVFLVF